MGYPRPEATPESAAAGNRDVQSSCRSTLRGGSCIADVCRNEPKKSRQPTVFEGVSQIVSVLQHQTLQIGLV